MQERHAACAGAVPPSETAARFQHQAGMLVLGTAAQLPRQPFDERGAGGRVAAVAALPPAAGGPASAAGKDVMCQSSLHGACWAGQRQPLGGELMWGCGLSPLVRLAID